MNTIKASLITLFSQTFTKGKITLVIGSDSDEMGKPKHIWQQNLRSKILQNTYVVAIHRILRYLKFAPGKGLLFSKYDHLKVEGYIDIDWAGFVINRGATSRYCMFVGGNLVQGTS